jgi:anthranilate synthase/aminodeoxychorismate synthase-like glutamine amidotransferase
MTRVLLLDNHDSFTFNLAELLRKNSKVTFNIFTAETLNPEEVSGYDKILFSPGPGIPEEHPALFEILTNFGGKKSILGICLGLQAIAVHFGAGLIHLEKVVHGQVKTISVTDPSHKLFSGIPGRFEAGLYHSWAVSKKDLPDNLMITALSDDEIIMGLAHRSLDISGVQFHPESIMTPYGQKMLDNWLER